MIEPNADRDAIHDTIRHAFMDARKRGDSLVHAVIDAKSLLIVPLTCPTCGGEGLVLPPGKSEDWCGYVDPCPTCHGSGRRDIVPVDRDHYERLATVVQAAIVVPFDPDGLLNAVSVLTPGDEKAVSE